MKYFFLGSLALVFIMLFYIFYRFRFKLRNTFVYLMKITRGKRGLYFYRGLFIAGVGWLVLRNGRGLIYPNPIHSREDLKQFFLTAPNLQFLKFAGIYVLATILYFLLQFGNAQLNGSHV